jgi:hypothetical protein
MSRRPGAPYTDEFSEDGRSITYEGHDCSTAVHPIPKQVDQPDKTPKGALTQNGMFVQAIQRSKQDGLPPERVMVFEKLHPGIWVYNGLFELMDVELNYASGRRVFKFKLVLCSSGDVLPLSESSSDLDEDDRVIPSWVKLEAWKRDNGRCRKCGAQNHLHFDHIIPYSKGGSSKDPSNIQILCLRHNLEKHDRIE